MMKKDLESLTLTGYLEGNRIMGRSVRSLLKEFEAIDDRTRTTKTVRVVKEQKLLITRKGSCGESQSLTP